MMTGSTCSDSLLKVRNLVVDLGTPGTPVNSVSLEVRAGEMVGIVGESGSGKSMTLRSMSGLLPAELNAKITGSVEVAGEELFRQNNRPTRVVSGRPAFGYVFQEPLTALNPGFPIRRQLLEAMRANGFRGSREEARNRMLSALEEVSLPHPDRVLASHPHELSGGMRQRVVIALALIGDPYVLLADEPTTALDVTVAAEILSLVQQLQSAHSLATVLVSHDLSLVAERCDRIAVMRNGEIVEAGDTAQLLRSPQHEYTKTLLDATIDPFQSRPEIFVRTAKPEQDYKTNAPLLEAKNVTVTYGSRRRSSGVVAVNDVNLDVSAGEVVGVIGESGSGKSSLIKTLSGLESAEAGSVHIAGLQSGSAAERRRATSSLVQMVFQDPYSSLNPRMSVCASILRAVKIHRPKASKDEQISFISDLLARVGLSEEFLHRFPAELSGGQRQRVVIARALAVAPKVLLADEPTSALDVSVQKQILKLLSDLVESSGLGIILVTHDFAAVRAIADRVIVMKQGEVVEAADVDSLISDPKHPYTRQLLDAVPSPSRAPSKHYEKEFTGG